MLPGMQSREHGDHQVRAVWDQAPSIVRKLPAEGERSQVFRVSPPLSGRLGRAEEGEEDTSLARTVLRRIGPEGAAWASGSLGHLRECRLLALCR